MGKIHNKIDIKKASSIGLHYLNHQRPWRGRRTKFKLHKCSQPSERSIVSFRYLPQFNSICSPYLNKGSYPDWRHKSCPVEMSLILSLYNEAIILYNLGQPEGTAIKYSRLMGGEWCTWWAGSLKGRRERIDCPLIYLIFALNCWLARFKENYHHGFLEEHINLVGAGLGWFSGEDWRSLKEPVWSWKWACSGPEVTPLLCLLSPREYRSRFTSEETLMFCMRVMVGVIILYDHVHPVGAFCKTSKIDVRLVIKCAFQWESVNDAKETLLLFPPFSPTENGLSKIWVPFRQLSSPFLCTHNRTSNLTGVAGTFSADPLSL